GACVEQDDKGWDARKRAYCLKIQPATGSFARNLIYSTKPQKAATRRRNLAKRVYRTAPLFADEHIERELEARPDYFSGKTVR
ncbi:hypothetical protein M2F68_27080, partial [Klebsiella pneumoniae]|nr:hypothetical protein [Klebsiella pneumoniae]